jgi:hypothetical protein
VKHNVCELKVLQSALVSTVCVRCSNVGRLSGLDGQDRLHQAATVVSGERLVGRLVTGKTSCAKLKLPWKKRTLFELDPVNVETQENLRS